MNAKKLGLGAGLAAAGVFAARSLGPNLHQHCQSMCAGKCSRPDDKEGTAQHTCSPQATREVAAMA